MSAIPTGSRLLLSGSSGFLGRRLAEVLGADYTVRGFDLHPCGDLPAACAEFHGGSVDDLESVRRAMEGVSAVVIAHMAPNRPGVYDTPRLPFDVNVKGAANLFQAAVEQGVRRCVLISSMTVVEADRVAGKFLTRDLPPSPVKMYGLTKALQEAVAHYYHARHGLEIAALRPDYIIDADAMRDKYGTPIGCANWQAIDPRDIGHAVAAALRMENLGFEPFYLAGGPGAENRVESAAVRLGWVPRHRFGPCQQ